MGLALVSQTYNEDGRNLDPVQIMQVLTEGIAKGENVINWEIDGKFGRVRFATSKNKIF